RRRCLLLVLLQEHSGIFDPARLVLVGHVSPADLGLIAATNQVVEVTRELISRGLADFLNNVRLAVLHTEDKQHSSAVIAVEDVQLLAEALGTADDERSERELHVHQHLDKVCDLFLGYALMFASLVIQTGIAVAGAELEVRIAVVRYAILVQIGLGI